MKNLNRQLVLYCNYPNCDNCLVFSFLETDLFSEKIIELLSVVANAGWILDGKNLENISGGDCFYCPDHILKIEGVE